MYLSRVERAVVLVLACMAGLLAFGHTLSSYEPSESAMSSGSTPRITQILVNNAWLNGDYERVALLSSVRVSGHASQRPSWAWYWLAMANRVLGETEREKNAWSELKIIAESGLRFAPDSTRDLWYLGWAQRGLGDELAAQKSWAQAARLVNKVINPEKAGYSEWYNLVCYRALAGDVVGALDAWESAVHTATSNDFATPRIVGPTPNPLRARWASQDPDLDTILDHDRFQAGIEALRNN